jgi:hypothetical protein
MELWDVMLEEQVQADYDKARLEFDNRRANAHEAARTANDEAWWSVYQDYLQTDIWRLKRQAVLEKCGGVCEACGENEARHVHHTKYPDVFGYEPLYELRGVCVRCHKIIHPHMR